MSFWHIARLRARKYMALATTSVLFVGSMQSGQCAYQLVWSDEFNGSGALDSTKWSFDTGGGGWGNNELEYYTNRTGDMATDLTANAGRDNGELVIRAKQESFGGRSYTSARIVTKNQGDWTFGKIEVKAKLPKGQGIWPAIWMLPTDSVYGTWPRSGEMDITEMLGHQPSTLYQTLHYSQPAGSGTDVNGGAGDGSGALVYPGVDFSTTYHVFGYEWTPTTQTWTVDGTSSFTRSLSTLPFNQRFHLLLNVSVGGNWPGSPDGSTVFPQEMRVDYVRVYQDSSFTPYTGSNAAIPGTVLAVNYDRGGQNIAYNDTDPGANDGIAQSTTFRVDEGVDTQPTTGDGTTAFNLGYISSGEWVNYTVDVAATHNYDLVIRAASGNSTGATGPIHLNMDGVRITPDVTVPNTGGYNSWQSYSVNNIPLTAGTHTLQFASGGGFLTVSRFIFSVSVPVTMSQLSLE